MSKQVNVKWGKSTFDITLDDVTLASLKSQLNTLSNVPETRQKLMCKGKIVDTDDKLQALPSGALIMMIGSAQVVQVVEVDPSTQNNGANDTLTIPNGLQNLGNSCWLNASLKALFNVAELRDGLIQYYDNVQQNIPNPIGSTAPTPEEIRLTTQLGKLMKDLSNQRDETIQPVDIFAAVAGCYPHLCQLDAKSTPLQQDADEFFTLCLNTLDRTLNHLPSQTFAMQVESTLQLDPSELKLSLTPGDIEMKDDNVNPSGSSSSTTQETEITDEKTITHDVLHKLRCTVSQETIDIRYGLGQSMTEQIEKRSPTLQRNAQYNRVNKLVTLPKYLIVHLQRFQWKSDTQNKAKIIRKVTLNMNLDLYGLATDSTQKAMDPYRKTIQKITEETQRLSAPTSTVTQTEGAQDAAKTTEKTSTTPADSTTSMNDESADTTKPTAGVDGVSGYYEMYSIVTHQGRDAESGHYVAWTKLPQRGDKRNQTDSTTGNNGSTRPQNSAKDRLPEYSWVKHDDDRISFVEEKDILNLSGGGDWHTAYICIYKLKEQE